MKEIIFQQLKRAIDKFYENEGRNLKLNVHEITHCHRLAYYFENFIREYDEENGTHYFLNYSVDLEFNRDAKGDPKRVMRDGKCENTRCDILLHSKGLCKPENLLVMELKKGNNEYLVDNDIKELRRMVSPVELESEDACIWAQWKFSGDKHKSLQVYTERTFHQRYLLVML